MSIEKQMLDVILKDLPNQTSGVLKTYLEQADKDKKSLETLSQYREVDKDTIKKKDEQINELKKEIELLNQKLQDQIVIEQMKESTISLQRNLDNIILRNDIESLKRENAAIMELSKTVFRNPIFKETANKTIPLVKSYGPTCGDGIEYHTETTEIKKEIE